MPRSIPKASLLLLDTSIIIECFRLGLWGALTQKYKVTISRKIKEEAKYFVDEFGSKIRIDLDPWESSGEISIVDVGLSEIKKFLEDADDDYADRTDAGELELMAHWKINLNGNGYISAADGIVYKTLARFGSSSCGVSLQELLKDIAGKIAKGLEYRFSKEFREYHSSRGSTDLIYRFSTKKKKK